MSDYMKEMERLLDAHERTLILHERGAEWAEEPMSTRAALLAHAAQAERDAWGWTWQPIETAPTDGTRILLRGRDGKIADGHYGQPDGYANPKQFVWPYIHANPTHWRPLPAQHESAAPVELPEPDGELEPNGQGFEFLANELFDGGGPIFSPSTLRTYGDAREAAGYARGLAVASRWGA